MAGARDRSRTPGRRQAGDQEGITDVIRWQTTLQRPCDATARLFRAPRCRHEAYDQAAWWISAVSKRAMDPTPGLRRHERGR
jgi:hypothetical protein